MELNYFSAIEAVLFASGTPVEINRLAEGLGLAPAAMREQLLAYGEQLDRDGRGIRLLFLDDLVQLAARREYDPQIIAVTDLRHNAPLSGAAMEVLAIIAYNQPVTKGFIEQVRGVESGNVVNNLVEKELIEEYERLMVPGRPLTYRTTANFLRAFGLTSLADLPLLPDNLADPSNHENKDADVQADELPNDD
ncbi:MAG TPA: SMC-Scp complex subunit ScpB [Candidatus Faecivivens stercorigallinarum]|nr:SMC-Scp complex subunit ScpB [Candidatus Faecivivens stercorigallinarum]